MSDSPMEQDVSSSDSDNGDQREGVNVNECLEKPEITLNDCVDSLRQTMNLPIIEEKWLEIPEELMNPKKMCAVNQFVHIVDKLEVEFCSYTNELVLVSCGTTVSDHFRWMIHCVNAVKCNLFLFNLVLCEYLDVFHRSMELPLSGNRFYLFRV